MPWFKGMDSSQLELAYKECIASSKYITEHLPPGIKLEFENLKCGAIFYARKHYAYVKVWDADKGRLEKWELVSQGLQDKRRNYCAWFRMCAKTILELLLMPLPAEQQDKQSREELIVAFVMAELHKLETGKVDLEQLARSCNLQASYKTKTKPAQKQLADRMAKRGQPVPSGSRLRFVYIGNNASSLQISARAELPEWVRTHKELYIDTDYYKRELLKMAKDLLQVRPLTLLGY